MILKAIYIVVVGGAAIFATAWCINAGLCLYSRLVSPGRGKAEVRLVEQKAESAETRSPILFVHGAWHGAWCWEEFFLPYFADKGYDVYALDLGGHGESPGKDRLACMRITDYIEDVTGVIETLPAPPIIVGHSMGGLIVQKCLEKVNLPAAVLMAPVPRKGVLMTTLRIARRHPIAFAKANLLWSLYPLIATPELTREAFFSSHMPDDTLRRYFDRMQDESYPGFLDMLLFMFANPEAVNTPVLVVGAEKDMIFSTTEVNDIASHYDTDAVFLDGMAHDMMLEEGWQDVADGILEWMAARGL